MRYRDLKDERDEAVARMLEAERLSMKSEFDKLAAEFAAERERLLEEADRRVRAGYRRGYTDGLHEAAGELTELKQRLIDAVFHSDPPEGDPASI